MIRNASPADAPQLAQLIILAMGDLAAKFVKADDPKKAIPLFEKFAGLTGNQYSYENCLVWDEQGVVCGAIIIYNGADLFKLRHRFIEYIKKSYNFDAEPEAETQAGEIYIDCLSVFPEYQGKGIAKKLINAVCERATNVDSLPVGLIVSKENSRAKELYMSLGFEFINEKLFMGDVYDHLQYKTK